MRDVYSSHTSSSIKLKKPPVLTNLLKEKHAVPASESTSVSSEAGLLRKRALQRTECRNDQLPASRHVDQKGTGNINCVTSTSSIPRQAPPDISERREQRGEKEREREREREERRREEREEREERERERERGERGEERERERGEERRKEEKRRERKERR